MTCMHTYMRLRSLSISFGWSYTCLSDPEVDAHLNSVAHVGSAHPS